MTSLSTQVYDRLRTDLMSGDLKPDQRLKIRELAAKMGTSETPVREAIAQLSRDGAIEVKPRYFVRVRRLDLAEYLEIRDIRLNLEPLAAERALPHITSADIADLTDAHRRLIEAEKSQEWQAAVQCNFEFHFGPVLARGRLPKSHPPILGGAPLWGAESAPPFCSEACIQMRIRTYRANGHQAREMCSRRFAPGGRIWSSGGDPTRI